MTATAPSKPWRLRCDRADDDPAAKPPRVQATRYLDRILQDAYQWMVGHPGRSCCIQHADIGPNDQATVRLDPHGRVAVNGHDRIADAVRVGRELACSWQPHDGVAVITHLTADGELQVRYNGAGGYLFTGHGDVPDMLGFHPASNQPTHP